jgi:hypothetical protein
MGIVVEFQGHARASAGSVSAPERACITAKVSKVTPSKPASSAIPTSGTQYSGGIRPRWAHLLMADEDMSCPAPLNAPATASSEGHRSKTARGVSNMAEALGPLVLNVKANMSCDIGAENHKDGSMDRMSETEETAAFISRVRSAREARFPDQKPMLVILDLDQGTYKQYETRTPLPRRYIPKFCAACGVTVEWLLTGEGEGPKVVPLPLPRKRKRKNPRRMVA